MLKKLFFAILLLNLSLYSKVDLNLKHYSGNVHHDVSGTVLNIERQATAGEIELADKQAKLKLEFLNKPLLQKICEPIYANLEYVAYANPFGIECAIPKAVGIGLVVYLGYCGYKKYKNDQKEIVT